MNSALKPVLPTPGVAQPGGQASPAKANVATANHAAAVGHPQGAQNSLHHGTNNLVGQNLTHHVPAPPPPAHPVPSMAPVSANMAQMAQNMSHHGNLSLNSVAPPNIAASPTKSASTSAPLSLVADKPVPLALTRTPEKKDEAPGPANGTVESPKSASNAPTALKPQNPEPNKEKQDIAKTSPSTPKPPEKPAAAVPTSAPSTPQKVEPAVPVSTADGPSQPKMATANEAPEKSPSKPAEPKPAPTADVAPTQSDNKPVQESASDNKTHEKPATPQKAEAKPELAAASKAEPAKPEERNEDPKPEIAAQNNAVEPKLEVKEDKTDKKDEKPEKKEEAKSEPAKPEEPVVKEVKAAPKPEEKKSEEKKPEPKVEKPETKATPKPKVAPRSTIKLATVTPPMRKRRHTSPKAEGATPAKKPAPATEGTPATPDFRIKRNRTQVQLYQSPTPELTMATKLSASAGRQTPTKPGDDKLIVFYRNEYLAVRNAEGSFYICQAMQNVYRTTRKIKIRWLSQDKADPKGETYKPDFYDTTDMECVLTTLSLTRAPGGGGAQVLTPAEDARAKSILQRAIRAEQSGANNIELTEEHPDGLDLSLYTDESQLEKNKRKRAASKSSPRDNTSSEPAKEAASPAKKARTTPKRSPKSAQKSGYATPTPPKQNAKRKPAGSTPVVAAASKTATAVTDKTKGKGTPKRSLPKAKEEPAPSAARQGRRSTAKVESKPSPVVAVPSTSTGKATRTPRKPPAKK